MTSTDLADATFVLALSADSSEALDELRGACAGLLRAQRDVGAAELLRGGARRRRRPWRAVAVATSAAGLADALQGGAAGLLTGGPAGDGEIAAWQATWQIGRRVTFAPDAARRLYDHLPPFREELDRCLPRLSATWDLDLAALLAPNGSQVADALSPLACELGMANVWRACDAGPATVAGAGPGAIGALAAAGALTASDALHLAALLAAADGDRPPPEAIRAIADELEWHPLRCALLLPDGRAYPAGAATGPQLAGALATVSTDGPATDAPPAGGMSVVELAPRAGAPDAVAEVASQLGRAFCDGADVDLTALLAEPHGPFLQLPVPTLTTRRIWPQEDPLPGTPPPTPPLSASAGADTQLAAVVAAVRELAARELGRPVDEVPSDRTFFDLGADSLLLIKMLRELEQAYAVRVPMRELFEQADSPAALGRLVVERAGDGGDDADDDASNPAPVAAPDGRREHLDRLVAAWSARTRRSKELAERSRPQLADSRASVGFRPATKELLYPLAASSATGAHLRDVDGNDYVDITMGFGILLFGHDPPFVREAVARHLADGMRLGPRSDDTGAAATLLCELTGADRAAFSTSGTEAVSAAIRVARAATGREKVAMFHGSYHGHFDTVLARSVGSGAERETVPVSIGIPKSAVTDVLVLDYGADDALEEIERHGAELAAVLVEPVQSRRLDLQPAAFLARLRELTTRLGVVLVFDEMLTGLRAHPRGAQGSFGVEADLATYGKVLGGGYPIGAIAGRRDLMDFVDGGGWRYGDDSRPERETTFFGGTYMQHPVTMAATRAVLSHLREQGPALQERLNARTTRLAAELNGWLEAEEHPLRVAHFGSQFRFALQRDVELLFPHLLLRGVYVWEWRSFFLSTAHTDDDVGHVIESVRSSLKELRAAGWVEPKTRRPTPPVSVVVRSAVVSGLRVGLSFFGRYPREGSAREAYALVLGCARFADEAGLDAVWLPERHFHEFGGVFPNPSVLAAAIACVTERVRIHAGSVVLPLHDPIRVAEEWSVVDNLSNGRTGLAIASGYHPNDFALDPDAFARRRDLTYERLAVLQALWRGEAIERPSGAGELTDVRLHPLPVQPHPPLFAAVTRSSESWRRAGTHDLGVLTNLMTQDVDDLAANIACYRDARAQAGRDPDAGHVVVLLHTYLAQTDQQARADARDPFCTYLRSSLSLFGQVADSLGMDVDVEHASDDDVRYLTEQAFERYCDGRALIGTVDSCTPLTQRLADAGANEIACFIDFGADAQLVRENLPHVAALKERIGAASPARSEPRPTEERTPASLAQERLWFLQRLHPERRGYNEPRAIRLTGPLEAATLAAALGDVVRRHAALRTRIVREPGSDGALRQLTSPDAQVELAVVDVGEQSEEAAVRDAIARESARSFDLAAGPAWTARLLRWTTDRHVLVVNFHHAVFDAQSAGIFSRDLSRAYARRHSGTTASDPPVRAYGEYAQRQRDALGTPQTEAALGYWEDRLTPLPPRLDLPALDGDRDAGLDHGASVAMRLEPDVATALEALARTTRTTLFMVMTTALSLALRELGDKDEVAIGTPVVDRPPGFDDTFGLFLNTLVLRVDLGGVDDFGAALQRVRDTVLDAHAHAEAPFEEVVRRCRPPRDPDRNPIFDVMIDFDGDAGYELAIADVEATVLPWTSDRSPLDLSVYVRREGGEISCRFEYATSRFARATVERLAARVHAIARGAVAPPPARSADEVEAGVRELWRAELALDDVAADASLFDLGADSLNVVRLARRIDERFGGAYPVVELLRRPTVRETAAALRARADARAETR